MNEIERKVLVDSDAWRRDVFKVMEITQGYLDVQGGGTVRVRLKGEKAFLTIKGPSHGITRSEFEYEIPTVEARAMIAELCDERKIIKTRHYLRVGAHEWVVDEFHGKHDGLVMAEVEFESEQESFELPDWAGREVSEEREYYNVNLARQNDLSKI